MIQNTHTKVVIVDDEPDFSDILLIYLHKIGFTHVSVAHDFDSGKQLIETEKPHLALLDIDLKSALNGINLGIYIREKYPSTRIVYFTNNFNNKVYDSVKQVSPNAFLDKQLNELKVRQAVELALMQELPASISSNPSTQNCYFDKEYIFVKVGNVFKKIELKDIEYIYYADRYANLQVAQKTYSLNTSIKDLAQNLPESFMQIHQSYIINLIKIGQINLLEHQIEVSGKWLPIGVSFRKPLRDKLLLLT